MADPPTLLSDLMDLMDASVRQGRAIERADSLAAAEAHRDALAALGRVLERVEPGQRPALPRERAA